MTSQGHPRSVFRRAVERGNYLVAVTTAREVGRLSLEEALELLNLIALNDARLDDRAAKRWLSRLLQERPGLTVIDLQLAAASLAGLASRTAHPASLDALRTLAEQGLSGH